ncbi:RNA-binding domain-containing protein [Methanococcus voltae]|uniref:UPF0201 protein Mvol_0153 n=1 Tax=Methanococcus voltae (strain ATCC BAA-1334 / A3) TaxID=456320 RepID=D7DRQ3_METV3|nr:RNA-binding domain-containing protein [Methanococcus voltae]MCS3901130.1 putative RNA binding protein with dsRBD fold (UPF0201 family) [Methanococcus voltae]
MIINLRAFLKPTESYEKVAKAITNIFPDAELTLKDGKYVLGTAKNINVFKKLLRTQEILDTGRMVLERGVSDNLTKFYINKQAAFSKMLNFDKDVHGGIKVSILIDENDEENFEKYAKLTGVEDEKDINPVLYHIIKDIAPKTKNGYIINEDEL